MGQDKTSYETTTKLAIKGMPEGYVKAKPLREKADLVKTNYSVSSTAMSLLIYNTDFYLVIQLGETPIEYETAAMTQFQHPTQRQQQSQPVYKNYN